MSLSFRNLLPDDTRAFKGEFPTLEIVNTYYTKEQLRQMAGILKENREQDLKWERERCRRQSERDVSDGSEEDKKKIDSQSE